MKRANIGVITGTALLGIAAIYAGVKNETFQDVDIAFLVTRINVIVGITPN